ncbi:outer membrane insertion C-terminal signal domain protein [Collimonas arenae]|uniref:Outer membrane insertion C-terminal signal domain protein n=1 Tax=Collimonas arenae TaxID=279058 RepID=A0A127QQQ5_9BURK|nr:OmpW family protein [Collimonas arenae]AMP02230.1 outer membrane insertion C-terminal signal domain protein [Collimonas arenae]AMP12125.1 outer membrane insertion C-terminal signal domain protein [Collimonas arenae]
MKKTVLAMMVLALGFAAGNATAQESPWQVRVRADYLKPANKSDAVGGIGASDRLQVNDKTIPEVDISYFFTPNWAAELVLTYPQKQDVTLDGQKIGTFKHLPPTLTLQYHFLPDALFSPYVGAGVNYTRISSVDLLNGAGRLDNSSWGLALQAGVDYKLDKNWSLNLDVKKVQIRSDVYAGGEQISRVKIDPWLIGVGVGYRF